MKNVELKALAKISISRELNNVTIAELREKAFQNIISPVIVLSFQNLYRQQRILVCHRLADLMLIAASKRIIQYAHASVVCSEHLRTVGQSV